MVAWLPPDPAIVGHARSLTAAVLTGWGLSELVYTTKLIVSELVTNAVLHAPLSGARFRLAVGNSTLRCVVSDDGRGIPRVVQTQPDEVHGRGLLLVSELADRWGVRATENGKAVWAMQRIPVRGGPSRSAGECTSDGGSDDHEKDLK
ncbi:ATP-binding protein [Streptomyces sp. NBC_01549]|uniref:ATP-binding protein n=1 Tax=Streptomyces sp. NBC_01549 TaxID=2975874 RepID=UPI0022500195|nr:ATP-binding protein [Streptomyces sp. NBC_01549]MCX4588207.1 ATP-binding protein [Streptomyces sp. NBC_01549]